MIRLAGIFVVGLIASYLSVTLTLYVARKHAILDIPNERSSHTRSVPRGGGLAIVAVCLIGLWVYCWTNPVIERLPILTYAVGALLVASVSWLDDVRSQPSWVRFLIHTTAAAIATLGMTYSSGLFVTTGQSVLAVLGMIVTLLWVVGLTNAYNFMDGIDGIAGGHAVVAGLAWATFAALSAQPLIVVLGLLLAASSLGFLVYNWFPARIFMGDVGATFLGYSFAVLPLMFNSMAGRRNHWLGTIALGILPVWTFVFDTSFTFLRRLRRGENVFSAHRSHLYQRLVILDYKHSTVTLLYTALAVPGTLLLLGSVVQPQKSKITVAIALPLLCLSLWALVSRCEAKRRARMAPYAQSATLESNQ